MSRPRIFIGSSSEGKDVADAVQQNLDNFAEVTIWNQGVFNLSSNYLNDLVLQLEKVDFAILVYTADDTAEIRGQKVKIPRDNVVFETGLFMGKLGPKKVFFLAPKSIKDLRILSDLSGISYGIYDDQRLDGKLQSAVNSFCTQVKNQIKNENKSLKSNKNILKVTFNNGPERKPDVSYYCKCVVCDDYQDKEEVIDAKLRWEPGGLTAIVGNVKSDNSLKFEIYQESSPNTNESHYWETDTFYPMYSIQNCQIVKPKTRL